MARALNRICISGRLTKDAESKSGSNGTPLSVFSIAVDRDKDNTDYFDVELWGKLSTAIGTYLQKGRKVNIDGCLRQQRWERDGKQYSKVIIWAENVELVTSGNATSQKETKAFYGASDASGNGLGPEAFEDGDDIPF